VRVVATPLLCGAKAFYMPFDRAGLVALHPHSSSKQGVPVWPMVLAV